MELASWPGSTGLAHRWKLSGADAGLQVSVTRVAKPRAPSLLGDTSPDPLPLGDDAPKVWH